MVAQTWKWADKYKEQNKNNKKNLHVFAAKDFNSRLLMMMGKEAFTVIVNCISSDGVSLLMASQREATNNRSDINFAYNAL